MKHGFKSIGMILAVIFAVSAFPGAAASAAETEPIAFTNGFETLQTVELNSITYYRAAVKNAGVTLTAKSSDESTLGVELLPEEGNPGVYDLALTACKNGTATVTVTAPGYQAVERTLTVQGDGKRNYTISSDTTNDFSISKGKSYLMRLHFTGGGNGPYDFPLVMPEEAGVVTAKLEKADLQNGNYDYRIEAVGEAGKSTDLFYGSAAYAIPERLCRVTVAASSAPAFVSDTTRDFSVNGTYQFKITTNDGTFPLFVAGTKGVFRTSFVRSSGNDYFFRLIAVGAPGTKAGIYVNGMKVLVATVGTAPSVKSDTTAPFRVARGGTYTFKLTADAKPSFVVGTGSVFRTEFVRASGRDYFFRVTATGKAGQSAGFYINSAKTPAAVATIA